MDELWTLNELDEAIDKMQRDPRLMANKVEWVLKQKLLAREHDRHGWGWASEQLRSRDRQFSDLSRRGIGRRLRQHEWADDMPNKQILAERHKQPPRTTRAHLRGNYVRAFAPRGGEGAYEVNWPHLKHHGKYLWMKDPFNPRNRQIESVIKEEERAQRLGRR